MDAICEKYHIRILGLNMGPNTYSQETAPYFYEQIVDNLNSEQLVDFYKCISAYSPELFSVNLYVTGLIMYYAGQLANKLIQEVRRSEDGPGKDWRPQVQIVFALKELWLTAMKCSFMDLGEWNRLRIFSTGRLL